MFVVIVFPHLWIQYCHQCVNIWNLTSIQEQLYKNKDWASKVLSAILCWKRKNSGLLACFARASSKAPGYIFSAPKAMCELWSDLSLSIRVWYISWLVADLQNWVPLQGAVQGPFWLEIGLLSSSQTYCWCTDNKPTNAQILHYVTYLTLTLRSIGYIMKYRFD